MNGGSDVTVDNDNSPRGPLRRPKRKLTSFLCRELLYEYVTGSLDPLRTADVKEFLPTDKASQDALHAIQKGLDYTDRLAASRFSPELMTRLGEAENLRSLSRRYMDWYEWPETLRWSISALAISAFVAGIVTVVPWNKLPSLPKARDNNTVVLADIPDAKVIATEGESSEAPESDVSASVAIDPNAPPETETSGDEHIVSEEGDVPAAVEAAGSVPTKAPAPGSVAMASPAGGTTTVKPTTLATAQASASVMRETEPSSAPASTGASAAPSTDGTDVSEAKEAKPKGFVYRAFMNVASVDEVTPEVTKQLESLGGEKAGEVPLGWRKGAGSYFHFTISETHVEEVTKLLRTYGPVRISKDPHPRVMPTGQVRFILWVEPQTSGN